MSEAESKSKKRKLEETKKDEGIGDGVRKSIRDELKQMSMEEIQALKEKLGLKVYNQALGLDRSGRPLKPKTSDNRSRKEVFKRENKNRPREISAKKQVPRFRDVVGLSAEQNSKEKRDPRFDPMCGEFDAKIFGESYKFVSDIKAKERQKLKEELAEETDPERIEQIKYLIQRYDNQEREKKKISAQKSLKDEERIQNRQLVKEGKKPIFMNKSELKSKELVTKFEELKKTGNLDKYLKKKNKQNASKDKRNFDI